MTTDPALDYDSDEAAEKDLFGDPLPGMPNAPAPPEAQTPPEPAPKPRRAPGPPPDPNSKRQQKLKRAQERARTAPAPPRKPTANKPAAAPPPEEIYYAGAQTIIGWVAEPCAAGGMGMLVAAAKARNMGARRRQTMARQGLALTLDAATLALYGDDLAQGAAEMAASGAVPWAARVLERAAAISPYATFGKVAAMIVLQAMVNHGLLPANLVPGTLEPEALLEAAEIELPAFVTAPSGEEPAGEG